MPTAREATAATVTLPPRTKLRAANRRSWRAASIIALRPERDRCISADISPVALKLGLKPHLRLTTVVAAPPAAPLCSQFTCNPSSQGIASSAAITKVGGTDAVIFGAPDPSVGTALGEGRLFALNAATGAVIWSLRQSHSERTLRGRAAERRLDRSRIHLLLDWNMLGRDTRRRCVERRRGLE